MCFFSSFSILILSDSVVSHETYILSFLKYFKSFLKELYATVRFISVGLSIFVCLFVLTFYQMLYWKSQYIVVDFKLFCYCYCKWVGCPWPWVAEIFVHRCIVCTVIRYRMYGVSVRLLCISWLSSSIWETSFTFRRQSLILVFWLMLPWDHINTVLLLPALCQVATTQSCAFTPSPLLQLSSHLKPWQHHPQKGALCISLCWGQSLELPWLTSAFLSRLRTPFLLLSLFWFIGYFLQDSSQVYTQVCPELTSPSALCGCPFLVALGSHISCMC